MGSRPSSIDNNLRKLDSEIMNSSKYNVSPSFHATYSVIHTRYLTTLIFTLRFCLKPVLTIMEPYFNIMFTSVRLFFLKMLPCSVIKSFLSYICSFFSFHQHAVCFLLAFSIIM